MVSSIADEGGENRAACRFSRDESGVVCKRTRRAAILSSKMGSCVIGSVIDVEEESGVEKVSWCLRLVLSS